MTDKSLSAKVTIVSGSLGGGIRTAIVMELSSRGATVVLNYPWAKISEQAVEALIRFKTPGIAIEADLSTLRGPEKLVQETAAKYDRIDILVNNASIAFNAYFLLTQATLRYLARDSRIVNVVSISARNPPPLQTICAGTKGIPQDWVKPILETTPVNKWMGEPSEIAYGVASLCEPEARWINGTRLMACGDLYVD
ncbi:hypothetical protein V2G26_005335 [Clonostachys chloroleuca]